MATVRELISDIRRQVANLEISDDSRLSDEHIYFVLNYCNAFLQDRKIREDYQTFGRITRTYLDPSILREYDIDVDQNGEAEMPAQPLSLPFNSGIVAAYFYDKEKRRFAHFKIANVYEAQSSRGAPWESRKIIRHGNKIIFVNAAGIESVRLLMASAEPPVNSDGTPNFDAPYAIPQDLIKPVTELAVRTLIGAFQNGPDTVNDNKDPAQQ